MNLTISSLLVSYLTNSPMLMLSPTFNMPSLNINSISSKFFTSNFLYAQSNKVQASITKSNFINFIKTPLVFKENTLLADESICETKNEGTFESTRFLISGCSNDQEIQIIKCVFTNCQASNADGGAILYNMDGKFTVHGTIFTGCSANSGGAIEAKGTNGNAKSFHSHYCCYTSCTCGTGNSHLGSAIHAQFTDLEVNYSATLYCPAGQATAHGAQIDLTSVNFVASSHINSTHGRAEYCSGIEYRSGKSGFFKFQNLVNHEGSFITALNDLGGSVEISNYNIVNVNVTSKAGFPGVIFVLKTGVTLSDIIVFGVTFAENNCKLLNVDQGNTELVNVLHDSYVDVEESRLGSLNTQNVHILSPDNHEGITTRIIYMLDLGECKGAAPITPPNIGEEIEVDDEYEEPSHQPENLDQPENSDQTDKSPDDENPNEPEKSPDDEKTNDIENPNEPEKSPDDENTNDIENPDESTDHIVPENPDQIESIEIETSTTTGDVIDKSEEKEENNGKKKNIGMIIGIVVAAVVVVGCIIGGVVFYVKKRKQVTNVGPQNSEDENKP